MRTITKYLADDGSEWNSSTEAANRDAVHREVKVKEARREAIAEQERKAAADKARAEAEAAELKRREELRPDREKVAIFADYVARLPLPKFSVSSKELEFAITKILKSAVQEIREAGSRLIK